MRGGCRIELRCRNRVIRSPRPLVMGIVNVNDDSFSGDGTLDFNRAVDLATAHVAAGADIIDVGAESARTNRRAIDSSEEIRRLRGWIDCFHGEAGRLAARFADQVFPPLLSVNTWRPAVVAAVASGIDLLNDISGSPDEANARQCAAHGAAMVIMHTVGEPKVPQTHVSYPDVMEAIEQFFDQKIALAQAAGLARDQLVLDPGIDFAKQCDDNLRLYRELARLKQFNLPILMPISRKTVIGDVLGLDDPLARDAGTVACLVAAQLRGAALFRVHNVTAAADAVRVVAAVTAAGDF